MGSNREVANSMRDLALTLVENAKVVQFNGVDIVLTILPKPLLTFPISKDVPTQPDSVDVCAMYRGNSGTWYPFNGIVDDKHFEDGFCTRMRDRIMKIKGKDVTVPFSRFWNLDILDISEKLGGGWWESDLGDQLRFDLFSKTSASPKMALKPGKTLTTAKEVNDFIGPANCFGVNLNNVPSDILIY
jgi:hypothetical protein